MFYIIFYGKTYFISSIYKTTYMKALLLLIVTYYCCSITVVAQSTKVDYEQKTIYNFNGKYQKGTNQFNQKQLITEIIQHSKEGGLLAASAAKDLKRARPLQYLYFGMSLTGLILVGNDNVKLGGSFIIGSLVPSLIASKYLKSFRNKLNKAVWLHNRDMLY